MFGFWSIAQMSLFFTLIGLFNAFLMWPVALLLYFLGVELIVCKYEPWPSYIRISAFGYPKFLVELELELETGTISHNGLEKVLIYFQLLIAQSMSLSKLTLHLKICRF